MYNRLTVYLFVFGALATFASAFVFKRDGVTFVSPEADSTFAPGEDITVTLDFRRYGMSYYAFPVNITLVDEAANTSTIIQTFETEAPIPPFHLNSPSTPGNYHLEVHLSTRYIHYTSNGVEPEYNYDAIVASVHFTVSESIPEVSIEPTSFTSSVTTSIEPTSPSTASSVPDVSSTPTPTSETHTSGTSSSAQRVVPEGMDKLTMWGTLLGSIGYLVLV